jgi:hypothetical protein
MDWQIIGSVLSKSFFEGISTFLYLVVVPGTLWIFLPGILLGTVFRRNEAYTLGASLGLLAMLTFGPLSF